MTEKWTVIGKYSRLLANEIRKPKEIFYFSCQKLIVKNRKDREMTQRTDKRLVYQARGSRIDGKFSGEGEKAVASCREFSAEESVTRSIRGTPCQRHPVTCIRRIRKSSWNDRLVNASIVSQRNAPRRKCTPSYYAVFTLRASFATDEIGNLHALFPNFRQVKFLWNTLVPPCSWLEIPKVSPEFYFCFLT